MKATGAVRLLVPLTLVALGCGLLALSQRAEEQSTAVDLWR